MTFEKLLAQLNEEKEKLKSDIVESVNKVVGSCNPEVIIQYANIQKSLNQLIEEGRFTKVAGKIYDSILDVAETPKEYPMHHENAEIVLVLPEAKRGQIPTWEKHRLFPITREQRKFFPGYRTPFKLETNAGTIETYVTAAPQGTKKGDPKAGTYFTGLSKFYKKNKCKPRDIVVIEKVEELLYKMYIKK